MASGQAEPDSGRGLLEREWLAGVSRGRDVLTVTQGVKGTGTVKTGERAGRGTGDVHVVSGTELGRVNFGAQGPGV